MWSRITQVAVAAEYRLGPEFSMVRPGAMPTAFASACLCPPAGCGRSVQSGRRATCAEMSCFPGEDIRSEARFVALLHPPLVVPVACTHGRDRMPTKIPSAWHPACSDRQDAHPTCVLLGALRHYRHSIDAVLKNSRRASRQTRRNGRAVTFDRAHPAQSQNAYLCIGHGPKRGASRAGSAAASDADKDNLHRRSR